MPDMSTYETLIKQRLAELGERVEEIDEELGHRKSADLEEQAIDLEDDEVLEGLGLAAEKEIGLLKAALSRIADGTYGICLKCGDPISDARLRAVPFAPLCRNCVAQA